MRICVFLPSYEDSDCTLEDVDDFTPQPGAFTTEHVFEYRFIHEQKAELEINDAISEEFEFYFNFCRGALPAPAAGVLASRHFEALSLPSWGVRSWERAKFNNDFYETATFHKAPQVLGIDFNPLVIKPANSYANHMINENSVGHNVEKPQFSLQISRMRRVKDSDDVGVYENGNGRNYACSVIEMGDSCIALPPVTYQMASISSEEVLPTFRSKFNVETNVRLLQKNDNPALFERLQQTAIKAFVSSCKGSNMGCNVDLCATPDGTVLATGVNPQPVAFTPKGSFQDLPITHSLPGRHAAVINIFIANCMIRLADQRSNLTKISSTYDKMAQKYDSLTREHSKIAFGIQKVVNCFNFRGTVLDLACGTGLFGRLLAESKPSHQGAFGSGCRLIGCDISPGMLEICQISGLYDSIHTESMEEFLVNPENARIIETVDHIVCFSAIQFLRPEIFSFVLVLFFVVANRSLTISIDEIPDSYNENVKKMGHEYMYSTNHLASMESFGQPKGWYLASRERMFSWTSPTTGDEVYTTYFRFERMDGDTQDIMFERYVR